MTVALGGNITLRGDIRPTDQEIVVLRKIIGRYVHEISEGNGVTSCMITCTAGKEWSLQAEIQLHKGAYAGFATHPNLYVALNAALAALQKDAKQ